MRIIIVLASCIFSSCAQQQSGKVFEFKEIGWTINLPESFEALDSSAMASHIDNGRKMVESSNAIKVNIPERKTLIAAKKGDSGNGFMAFLTPFHKEDSSRERSIQLSRELMFQTLSKQFPTIKLDSSRSTEIIDSLEFTKFIITGTENGKSIYNSVMLNSIYKGYGFAINYVYVDEATQSEIETMLKQSKFAR